MGRRLALWVTIIAATTFLVSGCPQAGSGGGDNGSGNSAPQANAGGDQTITLGETVNLDANGSSDPDGDELSALWTLQSAPDGSNLDTSDIAGASSFTAQITPDATGTFEVRLAVTDTQGALGTDTMLIEVSQPSDSSDGSDDQGAPNDNDDPVGDDPPADDPPADDPPADVSIDIVFNDPQDADIQISGSSTLNRAAGEVAIITVSPATSDAYIWYLDESTTYPGGEPLGTGSSIELDSVLITSWLGPHSLTVVAIQNGLAYSATVTIDIVDGPVEE